MRILKELYRCTEEAEIDALFEKEGVQDYKERMFLLDKCMGFVETFSTPEEITEEGEYELNRRIFVEATWRLMN